MGSRKGDKKTRVQPITTRSGRAGHWARDRHTGWGGGGDSCKHLFFRPHLPSKSRQGQDSRRIGGDPGGFHRSLHQSAPQIATRGKRKGTRRHPQVISLSGRQSTLLVSTGGPKSIRVVVGRGATVRRPIRLERPTGVYLQRSWNSPIGKRVGLPGHALIASLIRGGRVALS